MKSIRRDLAFRIATAALLILLAGGFGLYFSLRKAFAIEFDIALETKAQALVTASEIDDGEFEIDLVVQDFAGFGSRTPGDYFEIFGEGGEPLQRSPSLGSNDLALPEGSVTAKSEFYNLTLPDGSPGRAFWKTYVPAIDDDEPEGTAASALGIIVASDLSGHHHTLRTIALFISLFSCCAIVISLIIPLKVVGAGLKPLDRLSADVQEIDINRLGCPLSIENLPIELSGVAGKLNEMLARLESSFAREKRFTSDAAHELRTPLAELRAMTELGTRWPDEFTREHGEEMLKTLTELEDLLDKLALLARADSGSGFERSPIDLRATLQECLDRFRADIERRNLRISLSIEPGPFFSDPVLWRAIVGNLVGNAIDYAPEDSEVHISVSPRSLSVKNEAPDLVEEDIDHLFDRFWRKSTARSEKGHSGLGLSVTRAGIEFLGGSCRASLDQGILLTEASWSD